MKLETKLLFREMQQAIANFYHVNKDVVLAGESFSIAPDKETQLLGNIQNQSDFLSKINVVLVDEQQGQLIFGATEKAITGRRKTGRYRTNVDPNGYRYALAETDSGIIIPWQKLDMWGAKAPQFAALWRDFVQKQIGLDMIKVGFNGVSVAEDTKKDDLSDVNKGWLQFVRDKKPENMIAAGADGKTIKIFGEGADFANLDELAYSLKQGIHDRHRDGNDLVFFVGADLLAKQSQFIYSKHALTPTERSALQTHNLMATFGGMPAMTPPNMPGNLAFVTSLDNLSIYTQKGSIRRGFRNDEDVKGVIDSYYRYEGYAVEDVTKFVGIEAANVVLGEIVQKGDAPQD